MSVCPFTQQKNPIDSIDVNQFHSMNRGELRRWIKQADLGIDLDNACVNEWVETAFAETEYGRFRLVNPFTNTRFTEDELKKIYYFLSLSDENVGVITRTKVQTP